ncbi:MAG: YciI family protein [Thermoguttaceae bacterium]
MTMRFMVLVKADRDSEAGVLPSEKLLAEMGKYNEELSQAGVLLAAEGLHPSSKGARVCCSGSNRTVIDGPFPEPTELITGFWLRQVESKEEAIEWLTRCPFPEDMETEVEIHQVFEAEDFIPAFTPQFGEQEDDLRARIQKQRRRQPLALRAVVSIAQRLLQGNAPTYLGMSMVPWELLDTAPVPGSKGELRLYKRGEEFSIRLDRCELMNSRLHGSEDALAELACARVADRSSPHVLIGGLGMGYTTAAALHRLRADGRLVVAELVPAVVKWNKGPLADLAGRPLQDERVMVREVDVAEILKVEHGSYDAILMDVDNGPEGLTRKGNEWLYSQDGLDAAFTTLRPAGVLAVWSNSPDRAFAERLREAGFDVDEVHVRSRSRRKGPRHTIWLARRSP